MKKDVWKQSAALLRAMKMENMRLEARLNFANGTFDAPLKAVADKPARKGKKMSSSVQAKAALTRKARAAKTKK